jgi:dolichol-phosphate mannosyltransferase
MHGRAGHGCSLSLVIPAFNEEAGIAAAIAEADDALARLGGDYEILIVDDGSRDRTFAVATEAALTRPNVRVLRHETNRGYGAALRTGFETARGGKVAFTDADCQFDLADLAELVPIADEVPVVVGFRVARQDPWRRRFLSRGYNLLTRTLLGTRVRDCDCALKVFRRDALQHLLPNSTNFFVNTEMLTRARQCRFGIAEVGVRHRPRLRGQSTVSMSDVPKTLATLLPFWWSKVLFPARPDDSPRGGWMDLLLVLVCAALLFFSRIGLPLLEPEEARYAEIPRQMLLAGEWLVPTLHSQPYLDKPPLLYWMVMGTYEIFGVHDWAARLVPALCGVLTVAVAWLWAFRVAGRRAALLGAMMLCLCAGYIYYGRMLTMNAPLALFTTATLAFGHMAMQSNRRRFWLLAGVCCGLGLLTKGPIALAITLPPLIALSFLTRRVAIGSWLAFIASALAVAAPWYVAVSLRQPEFAAYFFWFHNIVRFVQPFDHDGPPWQYLPTLIMGLLPWALLLVPLVRDLLRHDSASRRPAALGAFLWMAGWALLFFSLAGSKRSVYLVPVFPPLALALGCYLDARLPHAGLLGVWPAIARVRSGLAYGVTALVLVAAAIAAGVTLATGPREPDRAVVMFMAAGLALAVLLTRIHSRQTTWAIAAGASFILLFAGLQFLLPEYVNRFSLRHQVNLHAWKARETSVPVVCYPHRWDSITFYTRRGDVREFSRERRPELIRAVDSPQPTLLFVQTKFLPELLDDLPVDLEFVPRTRDGAVTIGEVRRRREAPPPLAALR